MQTETILGVMAILGAVAALTLLGFGCVGRMLFPTRARAVLEVIADPPKMWHASSSTLAHRRAKGMMSD